MASGGVRLGAHASVTAVNQSTGHKLLQKSPVGTFIVMKVLTCLSSAIVILRVSLLLPPNMTRV